MRLVSTTAPGRNGKMRASLLIDSVVFLVKMTALSPSSAWTKRATRRRASS